MIFESPAMPPVFVEQTEFDRFIERFCRKVVEALCGPTKPTRTELIELSKTDKLFRRCFRV